MDASILFTSTAHQGKEKEDAVYSVFSHKRRSPISDTSDGSPCLSVIVNGHLAKKHLTLAGEGL